MSKFTIDDVAKAATSRWGNPGDETKVKILFYPWCVVASTPDEKSKVRFEIEHGSSLKVFIWAPMMDPQGLTERFPASPIGVLQALAWTEAMVAMTTTPFLQSKALWKVSRAPAVPFDAAQAEVIVRGHYQDRNLEVRLGQPGSNELARIEVLAPGQVPRISVSMNQDSFSVNATVGGYHQRGKEGFTADSLRDSLVAIDRSIVEMADKLNPFVPSRGRKAENKASDRYPEAFGLQWLAARLDANIATKMVQVFLHGDRVLVQMTVLSSYDRILTITLANGMYEVKANPNLTGETSIRFTRDDYGVDCLYKFIETYRRG